MIHMGMGQKPDGYLSAVCLDILPKIGGIRLEAAVHDDDPPVIGLHHDGELLSALFALNHGDSGSPETELEAVLPNPLIHDDRSGLLLRRSLRCAPSRARLGTLSALRHGSRRDDIRAALLRKRRHGICEEKERCADRKKSSRHFLHLFFTSCSYCQTPFAFT